MIGRRPSRRPHGPLGALHSGFGHRRGPALGVDPALDQFGQALQRRAVRAARPARPRRAAARDPRPRRRGRASGDLLGGHALGQRAHRHGGCESQRPAPWPADRRLRPVRRTSPDARPVGARSGRPRRTPCPRRHRRRSGPRRAAAAAANAAAFLAQPASSTPVDVGADRSRRALAASSASAIWRANPRSSEAITSEAPCSIASAAWPGPPITASARARQRSAANADGSVPSGGTRPFDTTTTPARAGIRSPWAASTPGSARAGTARHTRSCPPSFRSAARWTWMFSGSCDAGQVASR